MSIFKKKKIEPEHKYFSIYTFLSDEFNLTVKEVMCCNWKVIFKMELEDKEKPLAKYMWDYDDTKVMLRAQQ